VTTPAHPTVLEQTAVDGDETMVNARDAEAEVAAAEAAASAGTAAAAAAADCTTAAAAAVAAAADGAHSVQAGHAEQQPQLDAEQELQA
jgi:hypothetical protein